MGKTKELIEPSDEEKEDLYYRKKVEEEFEYEEWLREQEKKEINPPKIVKIHREEEDEFSFKRKLTKLQSLVIKEVIMIHKSKQPYWL